MKFIAFLILSHFFWSCSHNNVPGMEDKVISQNQYEDLIESSTKKIETYNGLYNAVNAGATLLRPKVIDGQLKQSARLYLWDPEKYKDEKSKKDESIKKQTELFMSFYTPERKHDDLHKNQTLWKIFLDVGGKRYEGKATKIKLLTNEVQGLYPYHTRFATPYLITFPVSMASIENLEAKVTVTGTVSSLSFEFPP